MDFETIFSRIKEKTGISNMIQLADFIGCSQQNVSAKKKKNTFPVEWAFEISLKYNLSTDWIMTGKDNVTEEDKIKFNVIRGLNAWLTEISEQDDAAENWFEYEVRRQIPEYDDWLKNVIKKKRG